ncbi:MAG: hypothetical protein FWH40_04490 [Coriobacteriia bacterium]|nr:hypothetical protein [Coriobacteriia bacterium]
MRPKHILRLTLVSTLVLVLSLGLYSFGRGTSPSAGSQGANKAFADSEGEAGIVDGVGSALPATYESAKSAFAAVLLDGALAYCPYYPYDDASVFYTLDDILRSLSDVAVATVFATSDIDGDGIPEVALELQANEQGTAVCYLLLHYSAKDGLVSMIMLSDRCFNGLKENGMFSSSGGHTHSYCRFYFPGYSEELPRDSVDCIVRLATEDFNDIQIDESGMSLPTWYVNGELASGNDFAEVRLIYNSSPSAAWHEYTEDNLLLVLDS